MTDQKWCHDDVARSDGRVSRDLVRPPDERTVHVTSHLKLTIWLLSLYGPKSRAADLRWRPGESCASIPFIVYALRGDTADLRAGCSIGSLASEFQKH